MTTHSNSAKPEGGKSKKPATTTLSLNDFRKEAALTSNAPPSQSRHDDFAWAMDSNNDSATKKEHESLVADHRRNVAAAAHAASSRSFAFRSDTFVSPSEAAAKGPLSPPTTAPFIAFLKNLPSTNTTSEALATHLHVKVGIKPKRTRVIAKGIAVIAFTELETYNDLCLLLSLRTIGFGGRLIPITVANESQRSGSDRLFEANEGVDAAEQSFSELSVSTPGSSFHSISASFAAAIPRSPAANSHSRNSISNATPPPAPSSTTTPKIGTKTPWRPRNGGTGANAITLLSREHMGNEAQQPPIQHPASTIANQSGNNSFVNTENVNKAPPHAQQTDQDGKFGFAPEKVSANHRAYVGNLSPTVTEAEVAGFFAEIGVEVANVSPLLMDKHGGSAFTFVDFGDEDQLKHILQQNGKQMLGRPMTITLPKNTSRVSPPPPPPPPAFTRHVDANSTAAATIVPSRQSFGIDRNRFGAFIERKESNNSATHSYNQQNAKPPCDAAFQGGLSQLRPQLIPPSPSLGAHPITTLRRTDSCETLSSFGGTSSVSVAPTPAVTPGGDNNRLGGNIASSAVATPPPKLILSDPAPPLPKSNNDENGSTSTNAPSSNGLGLRQSGQDQSTKEYDGQHQYGGARPCAYVGNLPTGTTEDGLKKHFSDSFKITITAARVRTKGPTTFAFVDFASEAELIQAVGKNGSLFQGRPMRIVTHKEPVGSSKGSTNNNNKIGSGAGEGVAQTAQQSVAPSARVVSSAPHCRTYVGNLPTETTESGLKRYFADSFGISILAARVLTKGPTTFAFVDFANKNDQDIAASKTGALFAGRPMRIVIDS